jgi:hypothetical protein
MASNMTKAFQTKSRRALGCRPGYAAGGATGVFRTGSNSFSDMPGAGGQLMAQPMGGVGGGPPSLPTTPPTSPVSPGGGQSLGQGALGVPGENSYISRGPMKTDGANSVGAYSDTPQGRIAADRDRMLQNGMSASTYQQFHSPDARMQQDAAAKVQNTLSSASSRDLDMLAGHNPTGMYSYNAGGNKVYANETADSRAQMRAQGMSSLGLAPGQTTPGAAPEMQAALKKQAGIQLGAQSTAALWGYADGGAVVKPQEDPAEAVLRRMQQNYGVAAPAPRPQAPAPAPTPAPAPQPERRTLGDIVRQRADELKRVTNYADGGTVRQVEFQGPGGPREDKIPVRFAGADIRVSDGERGVILPAKTAANPNAVDAIEDIIQSTNDGRAPRRGLGDGGRYADSNLIGPPKPGTHWLTNEPLAAPPNLHPDALQSPVSAAARGPVPGVNPWNDHITQSMGDAARLNGTQQSAEFARPQNIAPEIQIPADPAPVAEPQVRRGLVGRGVDALKGGARTAADATVKALGGTPGAPPAQPAPAAQPAAPVEKPPTPVTDRAKALGQSLGKGEVPGLIKTDAQGNRYLTKGGGAGAGAGAALQFGDHFDAFDTREGGLSHAQRAQLFARDLGVLAGGTAGAVGLGTVGFLGAGPVGAVAGGIPGGIGGAVYADKGMGKLREGINWANEKLGGAPNYFEDSDEMIARDRANREALGIKEGETQKVVRPVNAAIGSVLQSTGLINRDEPSAAKTDTSNYSNEGRGRHQIDPSMVEPINRGGRAQVRSVDNAIDALTPVDIQRQRALGASTGNAGNVSVEKGGNSIRWHASPGYNPTAEKFAPGTGVMTVTGHAVDGGRMMPGIKQHALGTSFAIGPGDYLAKDGSRTSDWSKTQAYEDAVRDNAKRDIRLAQIQNERAGRDPMASRVLGQQMLPPGEDAATDMSSLEAGRASVARNLTSPNPGTRSLAAHQQHVLDTMVAQQQAQAKLGYDMKVKGAEMANADKAQTRADAEAYDKNLATIFRNPKGGKDGNEDVPDTEAIAEFKRMAAYTAKANLEEATTPEQRAKWISKMTGKARDAAELDAADHAQMLQQFKVRQRHLATMGNLWGDPDVGDSQRLDHWTPHITKDGEMVYFPKMTKGGKPISGKVKQYAYTRPITASRFQALETPTNDILADAIRDK